MQLNKSLLKTNKHIALKNDITIFPQIIGNKVIPKAYTAWKKPIALASPEKDFQSKNQCLIENNSK